MPTKPFPLSKLVGMAAKRATDPLANRIVSAADRSPFVRQSVVLPVANLYNFYHVQVKLRVLKIARRHEVTEVPPMQEQKAVRLGADLLAEFVLMAAASALAAAEVLRHKHQEESKELAHAEWLRMWTDRSEELETHLKELSNELVKVRQVISSLGK
jgi:hypothetical protein